MSAILESRIETVANHLRESAAVKLRAIEYCTTSILAAAELIAESFRAGGKLMLCGNGGSAADCQHLAAEFTSRLSADFVRPGLPAIALTTDTSFLTAYANDFDFDGVFARQVQAIGKPGDVLIGISTSGRSRNVIRAFETARGMGVKTVALTGSGERRGVSPPVGSIADCTPTSCKATPLPPLPKGGNGRIRRRCHLCADREHAAYPGGPHRHRAYYLSSCGAGGLWERMAAKS